MNWEALSAISNIILSIAALLLAVYGRRIETFINRPKIRLSLKDNCGEPTIATNKIELRYYHILVENTGKTLAHNMVLLVSKVEEIRGDEVIPIWTYNEVPLDWQFCRLDNGSMYRNIGPKHIEKADLISVCDEYMQLMVKYCPSLMRSRWNKADCSCLVLTLRGKYDEGYSEPIRVKVLWDGKWERGNEEMQKHLIIRQLSVKDTIGKHDNI